MPNTVEPSSSNLDTPRPPVSITTDSSRRVSLRPAHTDKHPEPPTPISPPQRTTRKRATPLDTDTENLPPRIGDLDLSSASSNYPSSPDLKTEQVCLCQPDRKIPRPRNGAFSIFFDIVMM